MSYIVKVDVSVDECHKMFYVEISDLIGKGSLLDKFKEEVELSSKQMVKFKSPYLRIYWIDTEQDEISVCTDNDFKVFLKKAMKIYISDCDED